MTAATITPPVWYGPRVLRDAEATTYTIDASSEYVSWVIRAPKAGTIARIHFYAGTVTADGDGLRCRIETVTSGNPSGTLITSSSEVTHTTTTADSWNRGTAGLNAAVTRGQEIAVKLASHSAGTTFNGVIRGKFARHMAPGMDWPNAVYPYIVTGLPAAAKVAPGAMCFALEYDDGSVPYIDGAIPASSVAGTNFNTGSTPDERGNLFQVPVPMRVIGVYGQAMPSGTAADYEIILYDGSNNVLATAAIDAESNRAVGSSPQAEARYFDTAVSLSAATNYRLVVKPTTANSVNLTQYVLDTSAGTTAIREAGVGGTTWQLTTRADAGSWTETADTISCLGLVADQFDDGAGGGSQVGQPAASTLNGQLQR